MELKRMKRFTKVKTPSYLDKAIEELEKEISITSPLDENYQKLVSNLTGLKSAKELEKEGARKGIDPNTLLVVGGGIAQVLIIILYENRHVLTTKAMGFILKGRA